jgi:hypothetical protein
VGDQIIGIPFQNSARIAIHEIRQGIPPEEYEKESGKQFRQTIQSFENDANFEQPMQEMLPKLYGGQSHLIKNNLKAKAQSNPIA